MARTTNTEIRDSIMGVMASSPNGLPASCVKEALDGKVKHPYKIGDVTAYLNNMAKNGLLLKIPMTESLRVSLKAAGRIIGQGTQHLFIKAPIDSGGRPVGVKQERNPFRVNPELLTRLYAAKDKLQTELGFTLSEDQFVAHIIKLLGA